MEYVKLVEKSFMKSHELDKHRAEMIRQVLNANQFNDLDKQESLISLFNDDQEFIVTREEKPYHMPSKESSKMVFDGWNKHDSDKLGFLVDYFDFRVAQLKEKSDYYTAVAIGKDDVKRAGVLTSELWDLEYNYEVKCDDVRTMYSDIRSAFNMTQFYSFRALGNMNASAPVFTPAPNNPITAERVTAAMMAEVRDMKRILDRVSREGLENVRKNLVTPSYAAETASLETSSNVIDLFMPRKPENRTRSL